MSGRSDPRFTLDEIDVLAKQIVGIEGWQPHTYTKAEGGDIVQGVVPDGVYTKGPKKGRPRYKEGDPKTKRVVVITRAQLLTLVAPFEASGACWNCKGVGQQLTGWSVADGRRYGPCFRCRGTGKAPELQP